MPAHAQHLMRDEHDTQDAVHDALEPPGELATSTAPDELERPGTRPTQDCLSRANEVR